MKNVRVLSLVVFFVTLFLFLMMCLRKSKQKKLTLKELIQDTTLVKIEDTTLLKKLILDSLWYKGKIYQVSDSINVDRDAAVQVITNYQSQILSQIENQQIIGKNELDYTATLTSKSFTPINLMTGELQLTTSEAELLKKKLASMPVNKYDYLTLNGKIVRPSDQEFDLRRYGTITSVDEQGTTGACWAFAACYAYEMSYQLKRLNRIRTSEQQVINCSGAGTTAGGVAYKVFIWMKDQNNNLDDYAHLPYETGVMNRCSPIKPVTNYYASDWGLVRRDDPLAIPSVQEIKEAICKFGCVISSMWVPDAIRNYDTTRNGGVFADPNVYLNGDFSFKNNHAVCIIGWDDHKHAWLVKSSWGQEWGSSCGFGRDRGYMWLDYQSCNIGLTAGWIVAR